MKDTKHHNWTVTLAQQSHAAKESEKSERLILRYGLWIKIPTLNLSQNKMKELAFKEVMTMVMMTILTILFSEQDEGVGLKREVFKVSACKRSRHGR